MKVIIPELLTMPGVPKPLFGITPRVIFGYSWWKNTRQKTLEKHGAYCSVTGLSTELEELQCHEIYIYDFENCIAKYVGTCMLNKQLHAYFHFGRTIARSINQNTPWLNAKVIEIFSEGDDLLSSLGLLPHFSRVLMYSKYLSYYRIAKAAHYKELALYLKSLQKPIPETSFNQVWSIKIGSVFYSSRR